MFGWLRSISPAWWLAAALLGGAGLVVFGWRGRRIGDEPRCRRCRYILSDLPSAICPECGLDSAKRRPRRGVRRVRPVVLSLGLVTLLAAAIPGQAILKNLDWRDYAPNWVLLFAMERGDSAAFQQFSSRLDGRIKPGAAVLRQAAELALDVQQHEPLGTARMGEWLRILVALDTRNLLNDDEWRRMTRQCVRGIECTLRERCRQDREIPFEAMVEIAAPDHVHYLWGAQFWSDTAEAPATHDSMDDQRLEQDYRQRGRLVAGGNLRLFGALRHELPVGAHCATVRVSGRYFAFRTTLSVDPLMDLSAPPSLREALARNFRDFDPKATASQPIAEDELGVWTQANESRPEATETVEFDCAIVESNSKDDAVPLTGEALRREVQAALRLDTAESEKEYTLLFFERKRYHIPAVSLAKPLPYALGYRVFVRGPSGEFRGGELMVEPGTQHAQVSLQDERLRRFVGVPFKVVLRPTPHLLRDTVHVKYAAEVIELGPMTLSAVE